MGLTAHTLRHAVTRAAESARRAEDELNAADGKLGDGDTGVMLRRLFEKRSQRKRAGGPNCPGKSSGQRCRRFGT
jgi:hypothetical protein